MAGKRGSAANAGAQRGHDAPVNDRFEHVKHGGRVGVHRLSAKPRAAWQYLVAALVGIVVLTGAGILVVNLSGSSVTNWAEQQGAQAEPAAPKVKAAIDPTAQVVVLNGTPKPDLGAVVDGIITSNGWGQILFSDKAATNDVQISAVFYSDPADEAAALGLAKELGGVGTFQNSDYDEYGARLTVLLGADYAGPGAGE